MKNFLFITIFLCFLSCTSNEEGPDRTKPDPAKTAGISPEEKAQLEAKEKELIAKAQQNPQTSASPSSPGPSLPSLSGALSGIPPSYISICGRTEQVKRNILTKLKKEDCSKVTRQELESILIIDISGQQVSTLKSNDFEGLTSLKWLNLGDHLDHNQLVTLPTGLFQGLTSLTHLTLAHNQLTSLPEGLFRGLTSLKWLKLHNNQLVALPEGLFQGLTSLRSLFLENNQLTSLPEGLFRGLTSLQNLYLSHNQLTSLPEGLFRGLTSLQELYLHYNQLTSLPEGLFRGLTSLQELYLHYNQLTSLPEGLFRGLTSLRWLALNSNRFSEKEKKRIKNRSRSSGFRLHI